jgi:hypothetical protein
MSWCSVKAQGQLYLYLYHHHHRRRRRRRRLHILHRVLLAKVMHSLRKATRIFSVRMGRRACSLMCLIAGNSKNVYAVLNASWNNAIHCQQSRVLLGQLCWKYFLSCDRRICSEVCHRIVVVCCQKLEIILYPVQVIILLFNNSYYLTCRNFFKFLASRYFPQSQVTSLSPASHGSMILSFGIQSWIYEQFSCLALWNIMFIFMYFLS